MFLTLFTFYFYFHFPFLAIINAFLSAMIQLRVKKTSTLLMSAFKRYNVILKNSFIVIFNISIGDIIFRLLYI
ncbi:hypothetical protein Phpb_00601 [Photorhabdus namnaonensis]|uniref:Uncharacterized protein n=1 Tax=Photorhabdus namnaonensis TaxID=1851568 RepID=A0A1B8YLN1_9GAMM|nr:hypothetical protein Phpb_00601 [Photorhabdus namnaonensis]